MTVRPPNAAVALPHLVIKSRRALELESRALKAAVDEYASGTPVAGCPHQADVLSAKRAASRVRKAQRQLLASGQQQARLILVNAYDHLVSMGRLLGSDGSISLYAPTTLSRSVCEAAVRHLWLLGASLSYEERITRSAAALIASAENRLKGAGDAPERSMDAEITKMLADHCAAEYEQVRHLVDRAGMELVPDARGKKTARVELRGSAVKAPVKVDIGPLMADLLPESPGWYLLSSGTAHSAAWVLHSAVAGAAADPELALTPDLLEVAAAAESAGSIDIRISAHHPYSRNLLRLRPGVARPAEPTAPRHARRADARAGGQADGKPRAPHPGRTITHSPAPVRVHLRLPLSRPDRKRFPAESAPENRQVRASRAASISTIPCAARAWLGKELAEGRGVAGKVKEAVYMWTIT